MNIDRHNLRHPMSAVKQPSTIKSALLRWVLAASFGMLGPQLAGAQQKLAGAQQELVGAQQESAPRVAGHSADPPTAASQPQALALLNQVIKRITMGPAFAAKVRQRVWTAGREVIGVGIYEQAGGGSGRFNLHLSMHDGDGKHTLQQISDGRLDLDANGDRRESSLETCRRRPAGRMGAIADDPKGDLPPRLKIGAWAEMLDTIKRDYILTIGTSNCSPDRCW